MPLRPPLTGFIWTRFSKPQPYWGSISRWTLGRKKTYAGKLFKEKVINEKVFFCFINFFRLAYEVMAFTTTS